MNKTELLSRIRQLRALDLNAADVYADLGQNFPDEKGISLFRAMSADERRHIGMEEELIALLDPKERSENI
jgi:rubrerythrin